MEKLKFTIAFTFILLAALAITQITFVNAQLNTTLWTDKPEYGPSQAVQITGSGFSSSSTVTLTLKGPTGFSEYTWTTTSDNNGDIITSYDQGLIIGEFTLTATDGEHSAETTFTDGVNLQDITISIQNPNPVVAGSSVTYTVTLRFVGNNQENPTTLSIITASGQTGLPNGAIPSFVPDSFPGDSSGYCASTLTITTNAGTAAGTYTFTVLATSGGTTGQDSQTCVGTLNIVPSNVVPEYPLAGLAAILSCFGGFILFKKSKSIHF